MVHEPTTEEQIRDGAAVEQILDHEIIKTALANLKTHNYELFRTAKSDEDRVVAQARAQVLESFVGTLAAVVSSGKRSATEQERRDKKR